MYADKLYMYITHEMKHRIQRRTGTTRSMFVYIYTV